MALKKIGGDLELNGKFGAGLIENLNTKSCEQSHFKGRLRTTLETPNKICLKWHSEISSSQSCSILCVLPWKCHFSLQSSIHFPVFSRWPFLSGATDPKFYAELTEEISCWILPWPLYQFIPWIYWVGLRLWVIDQIKDTKANRAVQKWCWVNLVISKALPNLNYSWF